MRSRSGAELPQLELECLAALWELGPSPVATVHQAVAQRGRPLAYTTVLTVLERLQRKQAVTRQKRGRAFVYSAAISREQMRIRALDRLVGNYFNSREELRAYLAPAAPHPAPVAPEPEAQILD